MVVWLTLFHWEKVKNLINVQLMFFFFFFQLIASPAHCSLFQLNWPDITEKADIRLGDLRSCELF